MSIPGILLAKRFFKCCWRFNWGCSSSFLASSVHVRAGLKILKKFSCIDCMEIMFE